MNKMISEKREKRNYSCFPQNLIFWKRGLKENKKGQITIFVIVAIVIVAAIVIFFAATDIGRGTLDRIRGQEFNVQNNLENCIENNKEIDSKISNIMIHGGEKNPEFNYLYRGIEIKYLCYTNKYYTTCTNQQPMLLQNVEKNIQSEIQSEVRNCISQVERQLDNRGYDVSGGVLNFSVELIPGDIVMKIDYPLAIRRGEQNQRFNNFEIRKKSQVYELIMLATSIINFEATLGDIETTSYMALYPSKKVEKYKQSDGTTIYMLSDRNTGEKFNFASRSIAWPPGYLL